MDAVRDLKTVIIISLNTAIYQTKGAEEPLSPKTRMNFLSSISRSLGISVTIFSHISPKIPHVDSRFNRVSTLEDYIS